MNFVVDLTQPIVGALLLLAVLGVLTLTGVVRPWRSANSSLADRWKVGAAIVRYDLWLELRGVGRRRRRDLREELRANLNDAAEQVGTTQALAALGSLRQMSAEATAGSPPAPNWSTGATAAGGTFLAVLLAELFAIISWSGAADASGAARVQGPLPLFPGSQATWERIDQGFSIGLEPGWLLIAAAAIAFVIGSRPWLAAARRRSLV
jgi:hypothetical protein